MKGGASVYKRVLPIELVEGRSYFLVPLERLITHGMAKKQAAYTAPVLPVYVPENKKGVLLFPEGRLTSLARVDHGGGWGSTVTATFSGLQSKGKPLAKSEVTYTFETSSPYRDTIILFSTISAELETGTKEVSAAAAKALVGEFEPEEPKKNAAAAAPPPVDAAPAVNTASSVMSNNSKVLKNTEELFQLLLKGEGRVTLKSLVQRKNTPNLNQTKLIQMSGKPAMTLGDVDYSNRSEYSLYLTPLAILIMYSRQYTPEQRQANIEIMLSHGADPSLGLIGAILIQDVDMVRFLLEKGADPNTLTRAQLRDTEIPLHPFLETMPAHVPKYYTDGLTPSNDSHAMIASLLLTKRVFKDVGGRLEMVNESTLDPSMNHEVLELETIVTPKLLEWIQGNIHSLKHDIASGKAWKGPGERYLKAIEQIVGLAKATYDEQYVRFSEPGGLAYKKAQNRRTGRVMSNEERLAANRASNAVVDAMIERPTSMPAATPAVAHEPIQLRTAAELKALNAKTVAESNAAFKALMGPQVVADPVPLRYTYLMRKTRRGRPARRGTRKN